MSSVLRDMVESCSGEKRIQLDGSSAVIAEVLQIASSCTCSFEQLDSIPNHSEIADLIHFVRKYNYEAVRNFLLLFAQSPCESDFDQVFVRLLILMHMDNKHLCAALIDRHPGSFGWVNASALSHTHPLNYTLFALIPQRYHWAMAVGAISNPEELPLDYSKKHRSGRISPGNRFLHYLTTAEEASYADRSSGEATVEED